MFAPKLDIQQFIKSRPVWTDPDIQYEIACLRLKGGDFVPHRHDQYGTSNSSKCQLTCDNLALHGLHMTQVAYSLQHSLMNGIWPSSFLQWVLYYNHDSLIVTSQLTHLIDPNTTSPSNSNNTGGSSPKELAFVGFAEGSSVIKRGDPYENIYYLHNGILQVLGKDTGGGPMEITKLKSGDIFGLQSLLYGKKVPY